MYTRGYNSVPRYISIAKLPHVPESFVEGYNKPLKYNITHKINDVTFNNVNNGINSSQGPYLQCAGLTAGPPSSTVGGFAPTTYYTELGAASFEGVTDNKFAAYSQNNNNFSFKDDNGNTMTDQNKVDALGDFIDGYFETLGGTY